VIMTPKGIVSMVLNFLMNIVTASVVLLIIFTPTALAYTFVIMGLLWLGLVFPVELSAYLRSEKSLKLMAFDAGYSLFSFAVLIYAMHLLYK